MASTLTRPITVYPSLPRGAQALGTRVLREEAGAEYRCVDTLGGLWTLFRLRRYRTFEIATIETIAAGRAPGGLALLPSLESAQPVGGIFLGLVESVGPSLFLDGLGIIAPYQLKDAIAFIMLVLLLIFRPTGILGERLVVKKA